MADFDELLNAHKNAVYRQMVRACGSKEDAEDVLAEAMLSAYRAMGQLSDPEHFRAWLATIGRRVCGRLKAKEALAPIIALGAHEPAAEPEVLFGGEQGMEGQVLKVLQSLPPEYVEVITLRDLEELSGEATAQKLGLSLEGMKSRLHRARAELRRRMDACVGCQP